VKLVENLEEGGKVTVVVDLQKQKKKRREKKKGDVNAARVRLLDRCVFICLWVGP
jgi:hypothetical protein